MNLRKKVLVTGGAGYVGSVLTPKLLDEDYDVRILDLMIFGSQGLDSVKERCEIVEGDIRNSNLVKRCLTGINSVIHLAAISNDPCSDLNPELTHQVNFEGTKTLVEAAKKEGVKKFIYASSSSVYGIREELMVTEDLSLRPLTIYSKTKAKAEKVILNQSSSDFCPVCIRSATVCGYSPRLRLDVIVNILASQAITKGKIIVNGGKQKRPNIHIDDITDLYSIILSIPEEKITGEAFNYGWENYTVNEIAEIIKEIIGEHVRIEKRPPTADSRSYSISSEKIKKTLGIYPKKTIKDAVLDLKNAFDNGLIPNPQDTIYRNIARMKELGIGNLQ